MTPFAHGKGLACCQALNAIVAGRCWGTASAIPACSAEIGLTREMNCPVQREKRENR